ncbi:MAG: DUF4910 domain-containing protein [Thermodesulfovibrionales bacterium]|nr:DUF4910 domain-containing protein [Thermodesulfovibrionales bacterium]
MSIIDKIINDSWRLNRVTVGKDTTATSRLVQQLAGGDVLDFPSGTECLTWVIPKDWEVLRGVILAPDGSRVADFVDNPLHVNAYSISFEGELELEELKEHLFTDPEHPDHIRYHFRWQYEFGEKTKWGFSIPHNRMLALEPGKYRVELVTRFSDGAMAVNDIIVPGALKDTVFISAHTCHPAMVNDGIACVAVAAELAMRLRERDGLRYTYRFIFGPEYFAGAAFLSRFGRGDLKYGIYLDMLGNSEPLCYAASFDSETRIDMAFRNVFRADHPDCREYPYREPWGNDEMFYDGPGFEIPTVNLNREPYEQYHLESDDPDHFNPARLDESLVVLERVIDIMETDITLSLKYSGPLYLNRFADRLYFDPDKSLDMYKSIQAIQILMDGTRSYLDIADELGIDFRLVRDFGSEIMKLGLAQEAGPPKT